MTLERFVEAQAQQLSDIEAELTSGHKLTHWMWYVFPQLAGLGASSTSKYYAIADLQEAREYLAHPVLGQRLRRHAELVIACDAPIGSIFGHPDDLKFWSSMTLFDYVAPQDSFARALQKHFDGRRDNSTLELLTHQPDFSSQ